MFLTFKYDQKILVQKSRPFNKKFIPKHFPDLAYNKEFFYMGYLTYSGKEEI